MTNSKTVYPPMETRISGPVIAIGDIHGWCKGIKDLFNHLKQEITNFEDCWVVFLGDYVDRGPNTKKTLEFLVDLWLNRPKTTFVMGNHDLSLSTFLKIIQEPENGGFSKHKSLLKSHHYCPEIPDQENMHLQGLRYPKYFDGESTFKSFGVEFPNNIELRKQFPESFCKFFQALPWAVEHDDYVFVHSGMDETISYESNLIELRKRDFSIPKPTYLCDRTHWLAPKDTKKTIVSGHLYVEEIEYSENRIIMDTTGGEDEYMTALLLPENISFCLRPKKNN
ncbi:tyrosine-protein phosphatase rlph2 [Anaeramoeba flamelloides]|uniref:Tyrosine-protein phosphatase rlph2 n=1 Tax=Anaeramoeba flamelloides TaxID=1746091 RepID=A0ABQ8Y118_9EUKA|nr:tyrosine-protein phosphatase rlph2 [Anaeramoeba flamelloides]